MKQERRGVIHEKRPLFSCGITAVLVTAAVVGLSLWVAVIGVSVAAVLLCRRRRLCAVTAVLFLLTGVGYNHLYLRPAVGLDEQLDTITGVVVEEPTGSGMYTVRLISSSCLSPRAKVMLRCVGEDIPSLQDIVTARVRLYAIEENQTTYAANGAFVVAFPADDGDVRVIGHAANPLSEGLARLRRRLVSVSRGVLSQQESSVLAALGFGERVFLEDATVAAFQGSGLSHLLVVSGLHLSMVALAMRQFFRRCGRRLSAVLTLLVIGFFVPFVGLSPSVLRAALMCAVWLVGGMIFRRSDGLNSLGLAAMTLLVFQPYAILDVSFQLSFGATLGVLLLLPRLTPLREEPDPDRSRWVSAWLDFRRAVVISGMGCLAALLFTLPIAVYHFGGCSLTALPANMLVVPVAGAAMLMGWLGSFVGLVPCLGWLSNALLLVGGLLVRYMCRVATLLGDAWAWVTVSHHWQWLLLTGVCLLLMVGILRRVPPMRLMAATTALTVLVLCVGVPLTDATPRLTVVPSDNEGGIVVSHGRHCALLLTDLDELDEVVYTAPAFDPDVVFVGDGSAAGLRQLGRFSSATILTIDDTWSDTTDVEVGVCPAGSTATLWEGCRLTVLTADWWILQMGEEIVGICTDPTVPCPIPDILCVYVGGIPTSPPAIPYTAVCSSAWLRRHRPALTGRETIVTEGCITLTPQWGEWRTLPWL